MAKRSVPRRKAKSSPSVRANLRRSGSSTDEVATPAERMRYILQHFDEHANVVSHNALVWYKTPTEALAACRMLAESFYADVCQRNPSDGRQYVYLMLCQALGDIQEQLAPLFDCARQVAEARS
jgi:hypothetical protein